MAPAAELVSLRVLAADGRGYVSDVILALEWTIRNISRYKLRVVNMSLGHPAVERYQNDPLALAVERAVAAGLVVVASAGNLGKTEDGTPVLGMIVSPGHTPGALTVGAANTRNTVTRSDDAIASFSSRGPVGDPEDQSTWELKPDLVAPGTAVVAAGAPESYLWANFPERQTYGAAGGTYLTLSGSSMATAVTSGAVAQLLQARPSLTPAQTKFILQVTAERLDGFGLIDQGAGSLNVPLAVALALSADPESAPTSVEIAGEMITAGGLAFVGSSTLSGVNASNTTLWGNTIIWGGRGVGGDSIIWGGRGVGGDSIISAGRGVEQAKAVNN
jgi:subtilisin family serine protease